MFKTLKKIFKKKSAGEIAVKVNVDTSEAKEAINDLSEHVQDAHKEMNELSHIKLVTNDDNVPELQIDGVKIDGIADIKYHWHAGTDKDIHRYDIDVTYNVGRFEHHETIKDVVHAQMDRDRY